MKTPLSIKLFWALVFTMHSTYSQNFTEETNTPLVRVDGLRSIQLADIDADGDLDLIGISGGTTARLFKNNGIGVYTEELNEFISDPIENLRFVDIDGDDDMDMMLSGLTTQFSAKIWRYDGNYTFTQSFSGILQVIDGKTEFSDLDNDGDQDLLVIGQTLNGAFYHKYINSGTGTFSLGI
jgi:hypothetical protein